MNQSPIMKTINIIYALSLLIMLSACGTATPAEELIEEQATRIAVKTQAIEKQDMDIYKSYFGTLQFKQSTDIQAEMPGTVEQLKVKLGQKVSKGQVLLSYPASSANKDIESKQLDQAQIALNELKTNYERQLILFDKGSVNKVSVDQLKTQLEVQEKLVEQITLTVNKRYSIKAPYSGLITALHIQAGQQLQPGAPLFSIAKTAELEVAFYVLAKDYASIQIGNTIKVLANQNEYVATISEKPAIMDEAKRAFKVKAKLDAKAATGLYAGSTIEIKVKQHALKEVIVVAEEVVKQQGQNYFVYVTDGAIAKQRKVQIGYRQELNLTISDGLQAGEQLIVAGMDKLKDDAPIAIVNQ